jgi:CheY-like chemotaxis protein
MSNDLTILVAEDEMLIRDMLCRYLTLVGFQVVCVGDGAAVIAAVAEQRPHLILMDLSMPVVDGLQATAQLKADPRTAGIPVIALTAFAFTDDRERAAAAGCDEFEVKPVEFERLIGKIRRLIGLSGPA